MTVDVERRDGLAIVTLNWPERRNALGPSEADALAKALTVGEEPSVHSLVLTGNGAFCAGGDLVQILELVEASPGALRTALYGAFQHMIRTLVGLPVPTVAAIDGPAIGLGMDLALACDVRFVGENGWLRQGWASLGLIPATGGIHLLQRLHPTILWELVTAQQRVTPTRAAELGLAETTSGHSALEPAIAHATQLTQLPANALRAYVELSRHWLQQSFEKHLDAALDLQVALLTSPDFRARAREMLADRPG
jgi:2-(1,2-epoxy-1,2-dihydrophenyl)acetyl-CoA isomerase